MKQSPSIAAIVTCHNYGHFLAACLESLLRQKLPFSEILLIDDDSEDQTPEIAARYAHRGIRYERVSFRNVALAREQGVKLTSSEFLVCVDADDWLEPEFTEVLVEPLLRSPEISFAYPLWYFHFDDEKNKAFLPQRYRVPRVRFSPYLLKQFNYITNTAMVRRSAWLGQDPEFSGHLEDWDHWLRIAANGGKGVLVPEPLFHYRIHARQGLDPEKYRLAKDKAKRKIHEKYRYADFDLTLLVLVPEVLPDDHPFFSSLGALELPERTQRLIVNLTGDRAFHRRLEKPGIKVLSFPYPARKLPIFSASRQPKETLRSLNRAFRFAGNFIEGRKTFVWTASALPADAFLKMSRRLNTNSTLVTACQGTVFLTDSFELPKIKTLGPELTEEARAAEFTVEEEDSFAGKSISEIKPASAKKNPGIPMTGIVICHNQGAFLARSLDSFLSQTHPFDEIILVDDSSQDGTFEVWQKGYRGRVKYLRIDQKSQMAARTAGVLEARGELIAFLDADDFAEPDFLKCLYQEFISDEAETLGAVFPRMKVARDAGQKDVLSGDWGPPRPWREKMLFEGNTIPSAALVRKRAWPVHNRPFGVQIPGEAEYAEDWDVWLSMLREGWRLRRVDADLFTYFSHENGLTERMLKKGIEVLPLLDEVRRRNLPYDLSVVVFLHAGMFYIPELLAELKALAAGKKKQILFIDGSGGGGLEALLRPYAQEVFYCREKDFISCGVWKHEALKRFAPQILGRDVLIWDAAYAPPPGAYEKMTFLSEEKNCPFVSALREDQLPGGRFDFRKEMSDPAFLLFKNLRFSGAGKSLLSKEGQVPASFCESDCSVETKVVVRSRTFSKGCSKDRVEWPGVSIVIPVKNNPDGLHELLASLQKLDYPKDRFEVLVVDNGSSDQTRSKAEAFPGVKLLIQPAGGSYAARNRGLWAGRFSLIAFLDSDCRVTEGWLKELVEALEQDERIGAVAGDNRSLNPASWISRVERRFNGYSNFKGEGIRPPYGITMNILYRREVFRQCGSFDPSLYSGGDVEMSWRMQASGWWRLEILKGKGLVLHADVTRLKSWYFRHLRIGGGVFWHYERHPEFFDANLRWLPLCVPEILLQALLHGTLEQIRALKNPDGLSFLERFGRLFRITVQKLGYLNEMKKAQPLTPAPRAPENLLFFGDQPCEAWAPCFPFLLSKTKHPLMRVLAIDPLCAPGASWADLLRVCLGLTTVWRWPSGIRSMRLWQLFPESRNFPFFAKWNLWINQKRIRKNAGLKKGTPVHLGGWVKRRELLMWKKRMGEDAVLWENLETQFQRTAFPSVGCVLSRWENDLDWKTLLEAARVSPWPVWVFIQGRPQAREIFFDPFFEARNLKIVFGEDLEEAVRFAASKTAVLFYPFQTSADGPSVIPEVFNALIDRGLPVITTCRQRAGGGHPSVKEAVSSSEALRLLRQIQNFPFWNLSTLTSRKGEGGPFPGSDKSSYKPQELPSALPRL